MTAELALVIGSVAYVAAQHALALRVLAGLHRQGKATGDLIRDCGAALLIAAFWLAVAPPLICAYEARRRLR